MPASNCQVHRPGPLKQQNKSHKTGRHRSKGALDAINKGRSSIKEHTKKQKHETSKKNKRKQAFLLRQKKRDEVLNQKRGLGCEGAAPILTVVLATSRAITTDKVIDYLKECDEDSTVVVTDKCVQVCYPRFKQRFTFVSPSSDNIEAILDYAKVADTLLLVHPLDFESDIDTDLLTALFAQGLPSTVHTAIAEEDLYGKNINNYKKLLTKNIQKRFPGEKPHFITKSSDCFVILRQIGSQKQRHVTYRDQRGYLLAENFTAEENGSSDTVTVKLTGYIRSQPVSVNRLIHICNWGDFQLSKIELLTDVNPLNKKCDYNKSDVKLLEKADPTRQESLQSENIPDLMDAEQTWPTEEEMKQAEELNKTTKKTLRVPKGTSEYQAAWIVDSDIEEGSSESDGDDKMEEDEDMEKESEMESDDNDEEEDDYENLSITDENAKYDDVLDINEDYDALHKFRISCEDEDNPDDVDLTPDLDARVRLQKYRGLKSFRTSPWDPKENLPADYAKIFQFQNFAATKKRVLNEEVDGAMPGWFVALHVSNVPKSLVENVNNEMPMIAFGLFPHEQKMSVLNFTIKRVDKEDTPEIRSKDELIFHVGFRKFAACPILSQHTFGNKHKYERVLSEEVTVATVFAPITFPPMPVLVYKELNGRKELVATGNVLNVNPDRIVVKRINLCGNPFKINRKSAVVRHMFFHREDIEWFKPVELRTKSGRRGHIKEPLGTHGHMKCTFDGQLKSNEKILLSLYKRVFPKWNYNQVNSFA